MNRSPFRSARAVSTTVDTDPLAEALALLARARENADELRRAVGVGQAPASALTVAEWQLHLALRRVDQLRSQADYGGDAA